MTYLPNFSSRNLRRYMSRFTVLLTILLIVAGALPSQADDVGLVTAKLTEKANHSYVLEADVPPQLLKTLGVPILPEGFLAKPTEIEKRGALINVRYPFTGESAMGPEHTILLPWTRNGVLVNARWLDGSRSSQMCPTTVKGIEIEIAPLRTIQKTRSEANHS